MRRVLLTGGSGFIGRNIRESYLSERYEIISPGHAELDVADEDSVDSFLQKNRFDYVIHAATKPGHRNAKDQTNLFYTNTRMFFNLAKFGDRYEKMIVLGSGAIYDMRNYHHLMREEEWKDHIPADEHGFCKYVCETYIEKSSNIIDLRLFGIFGKYEDYAIRFISNMICKALFDLPLTIKRDRVFHYLYIEDLCPFLDYFLANNPRWRSYNITPDAMYSLSSLAELVLRATGKALPIEIAQSGNGPEYTGDNSRLRAEFGEFRFTDMADAVSRLVEWYRGNISAIDRSLLLQDK